ncbi:MAG: dihydropteroate synthase [Actinomycetia bacterium]|nr:dihydropteroate synthase [Actinomycetes bacterium]
MLIIGEKINGTRAEVGKAVRERNGAVIEHLARQQVDAGAAYLDVNAGSGSDTEADDLIWLIRTVQSHVSVPLCLDSPNAATLAAAIEVVEQQPMVNSISGESDRLNHVLPLVVEHQCPVILVALDDTGIPKTVDDRLAIIDRLIDTTRASGIADNLLYVDPLIMAVSTGDDAGVVACETIRGVRERYPDAHITGGLSNISFGAPARQYLNQAFLVLAMEAGMDSAIMDPSAPGMGQLLLAVEAVLGRDRFCNKYNRAYRNGKLD